MPVNSEHPQYTAFKSRWARCRDTYSGSDAVKAKGVEYLPMLEGHVATLNTTGQQGYNGYLKRASFYPAEQRTVQGLVGLLFARPPSIDGLPASSAEDMKDVTLSGVPLLGFNINVATEVLITGRCGVMLDYPTTQFANARPYWVRYQAEQILNWRYRRINGQQTLTRVVLYEQAEQPNADDPFVSEFVDQCRVLELVSGYYQVTVWTQDPKKKGSFIQGEPRIPLRLGLPVPFIPFRFFGPNLSTADIENPPLLDLVDVNLSHYRTSADHEHGAHKTALPTPWITGHKLAPGETLGVGADSAWVIANADARVGMLEYSGAGIKSLVDLKEEKRLLMATLGARMLETQKTTQEAAATVRLRHAGESSALKVMANALGQGFSELIKWHLWWSTISEMNEMVAYLLNPDAMDELTSADIAVLVASWQAGAISKKTLHYNLTWGEWTRPDVTFEQEQADIDAEDPADTDPLPDDIQEGE